MKIPTRKLLPLACGLGFAISASAATAAVDSIDLNAMFGGTGMLVHSEVPGDDLGQAVSIIGDINADGFDDFLIGAPAGDANVDGLAYVIFGRNGGFASTFSVDALNGSNGFVLSSTAAGDMLGRAAAGMGDINADGIDDFMLGAPRAVVSASGAANVYSAGKTYVVLGHGGAYPAVLNLDTLDGSNGFRLEGANTDTGTGFALAAAGDFNGDGLNDMLIGSHGSSSINDAWVVLGSAGGFAPVLSLAAVPSSGKGFQLMGTAGTELGRAVAGIGDINADGMDDVLVGAPATMVGTVGNAGRSYVVFGRSTTPGGNALSLDAPGTADVLRLDGVGPGDVSGSALAGIGDVNGDAVADFIIGTPQHGAYVGGAFVVFGGATLSSMSLAEVVSSGHGFRLGLLGGYNTNAGAAVSAAGDVNGDGIADFMVAIPGGHPSAEVNREVAVLFGHDAGNPWPDFVNLADFDNGMRLEHSSQVDVHRIGDLRGYVALAGGGDMDGDGLADMLVGSPRALEDSTPGTWLGRAYAVFGRSGPLPDLIFRDGFEVSP